MICTSLEQSEKLIELGIDVNTADMFWMTTDKTRLHVLVEDLEKYSRWDCMPAWSLVALLDVIKPINENTYTIRGTLDGGATISFDEITNVMFQEEEIIDAVFEMIVWLKENGKI